MSYPINDTFVLHFEKHAIRRQRIYRLHGGRTVLETNIGPYYKYEILNSLAGLW